MGYADPASNLPVSTFECVLKPIARDPIGEIGPIKPIAAAARSARASNYNGIAASSPLRARIITMGIGNVSESAILALIFRSVGSPVQQIRRDVHL